MTINDASWEHGINGPDGLKRWGFGYALGKGRLSNDALIDIVVGNPSATHLTQLLPGSGEVRVVVYEN